MPWKFCGLSSIHKKKLLAERKYCKKKVVTFSRNETFCMRFHCQFVLEQAPQTNNDSANQKTFWATNLFFPTINSSNISVPKNDFSLRRKEFFLIWNLGRTLIIWTDTRCSFLKFLLNDGDLTWAAQAHNEEKAVFHVKNVYIIITIIAAVFFRKLFRSFSSFFWLSFSFFVWSASERKWNKSIRNND